MEWCLVFGIEIRRFWHRNFYSIAIIIENRGYNVNKKFTSFKSFIFCLIFTIETFKRSAAEPCIVVLMACLSASLFIAGFGSLIYGR